MCKLSFHVLTSTDPDSLTPFSTLEQPDFMLSSIGEETAIVILPSWVELNDLVHKKHHENYFHVRTTRFYDVFNWGKKLQLPIDNSVKKSNLKFHLGNLKNFLKKSEKTNGDNFSNF